MNRNGKKEPTREEVFETPRLFFRPIYLFLIVIFSILFVDGIMILTLHPLTELPLHIEVLLGSFILIVFLLPVLYLFFLKPLKLHIKERRKIEAEQKKTISELGDALEKVKVLSGLLPICASCKRIRDDKGNWTNLERYISERTEAEFTHSICPECEERLYGSEPH
ncbi:hypothetical protein ANRL4_04968 [Anaerolineae bacterium]|nr:hypothetical protein ANRL4_04968 [Anaerolineae bacterium]